MNPFLPLEIKETLINDDIKRQRLKDFHNDLYTAIKEKHPIKQNI